MFGKNLKKKTTGIGVGEQSFINEAESLVLTFLNIKISYPQDTREASKTNPNRKEPGLLNTLSKTLSLSP